MEKILAFSSVLEHIADFPWNEALFLPENHDWSLDSRCAVLDLDDLGEDEDRPRFAADNGLIYAMTIQQLQGIVSNARQQWPECSPEDLLQAFLHYHRYDAFMVFE
jgi:hypothetical protein